MTYTHRSVRQWQDLLRPYEDELTQLEFDLREAGDTVDGERYAELVRRKEDVMVILREWRRRAERDRQAPGRVGQVQQFVTPPVPQGARWAG